MRDRSNSNGSLPVQDASNLGSSMSENRPLSALFGAAIVLGFALSGFFDGVLLHQILQWHHLLSLVRADALFSLRAQILADGLFHALMYLVAVAGLILLWRARQALAAQNGSRRLWSGVLVGFGGWNVVDVGLFHWILGIHRIRLDVPNPLAWDMGWVIGLGLFPIALGLILTRRHPRLAPPPLHSVLALLVLLGAAGLWNLRTPPPGADTLAVFAAPQEVLPAVAALDARLIQTDASGTVAVLRLSDAAPWRLYRHGALLVQNTGPAGCFNWSKRLRSDAARGS